MAYVPKNLIEQHQIDTMNNQAPTLIMPGGPTTTGTNGNGAGTGPGTQGGTSGTALAVAQGSGGLGSQFTNFQDLVDANKAATANQADTIGNTIGIKDATDAFGTALSTSQAAANSGINNYDSDFLTSYLSNPYKDIDQAKYANLASIIGGYGYKGPTSTGDLYADAKTKLNAAQTNAGLLDDPYGLQTILSKNPTGGSTAGGIALDSALLSGNEAARSKFNEVKTTAGGLTDQFNTSQTAAQKAINDAQTQEGIIANQARQAVSGAQQDIRTAADAALADKRATENAQYKAATDAAKTGNFSQLKGYVPDSVIAALNSLYGKITPGTAGDLGQYVSKPTTMTSGYSTGDVLTPDQIAKYQAFGNLLGNSNDPYVQAAKGGLGGSTPVVDTGSLLAQLQSVYGTQSYAQQQLDKAAAEDASKKAQSAALDAAQKAADAALAAERDRGNAALAQQAADAAAERDRLQKAYEDALAAQNGGAGGSGGSGGGSQTPIPGDNGTGTTTPTPGGGTTTPTPGGDTGNGTGTIPTPGGSNIGTGPDYGGSSGGGNTQTGLGGNQITYPDTGYDNSTAPRTDNDADKPWDYTDSGSGGNSLVDWIVDNYPDGSIGQNVAGTLISTVTGLPLSGTAANWIINQWKNSDPTNASGKNATNGSDSADDAAQKQKAREAAQAAQDQANGIGTLGGPDYSWWQSVDPVDNTLPNVTDHTDELNNMQLPDISGVTNGGDTSGGSDDWGYGSSGDYYSDAGGSGGSTAGCVEVCSFMPTGIAGKVKVGDTLQLADEKTLEQGTGVVSYSQKKVQPGYLVVTRNKVALLCSSSAPIPTKKGLVLAPDLAGHTVATRIDKAGRIKTSWSKVQEVIPVGDIEVQHITVGDKCFWAGFEDKKYILHHNIKSQEHQSDYGDDDDWGIDWGFKNGGKVTGPGTGTS